MSSSSSDLPAEPAESATDTESVANPIEAALENFSVIPAAPEGFRSGFVSIVGRPNVGKSTLLNQLVGQKIAIVSPTAQTTRNRLQGILTLPNAQAILVDTPGIHKPHHQLGKILVQNALGAIRSADVLIFVVDGSAPLRKGDRFIADWVRRAKVPTILGINKADLQSEDSGDAIDESYRAIAEENGWAIIKFSALTGDGMPPLLDSLVEGLEPGPYYYPPDLVTDSPERFIMAELIREQILLHTRQEVPHSVAIAIEKVQELKKATRVMATVNVERKSQKGILIGKGGAMLKTIGTAARQQIQRLVNGKVHLELFVRVQSGWRQSRMQLSEFGYRIEE